MSTSNNNIGFFNRNTSRSFNQSLSTVLVSLSSQSCSEVIIINKTGQSVYIYDNGYTADSNRLLLDSDDSMVIRGVTNSDQISAKTVSSSGTLYYRTQQFSLVVQ